MTRVTVHHFRRYDIFDDVSPSALPKATAENITKWNCEIIPGTAEDVETDQLDEEGRYYPPGARPKEKR